MIQILNLEKLSLSELKHYEKTLDVPSYETFTV